MLEALSAEELKPIRELVHVQLRDAIISGEIRNGERLIEADLAERLNVSRTPVREAIRMLESEGLVESLARRGVIVKNFRIDDIVEIYKIRQALEVMAFQSATEHVTPYELQKAASHLADSQRHLKEDAYELYCEDNESFTEVLVKASRMERTMMLIATYRDQLRNYRRMTLASVSRQQTVIKEHSEILEAMKRRDAELVRHLVFIHLQGALEECKQYLATHIACGRR